MRRSRGLSGIKYHQLRGWIVSYNDDKQMSRHYTKYNRMFSKRKIWLKNQTF